MKEQNTDQPQPTSPLRSRRRGLRWLAVPAAVAVLALVYHLTRPPELVWWRSPAINETKHHIRVLVPSGWTASWERVIESSPGEDWLYCATVTPVDNRPAWLRRMFSVRLEHEALLHACFERDGTEKEFTYHEDGLAQREFNGTIVQTARRRMQAGVPPLHAIVYYGRENLAAFNRTYKQICDSLTIE